VIYIFCISRLLQSLNSLTPVLLPQIIERPIILGLSPADGVGPAGLSAQLEAEVPMMNTPCHHWHREEPGAVQCRVSQSPVSFVIYGPRHRTRFNGELHLPNPDYLRFSQYYILIV
jgi:hypothetical protein